MRWLLSIAAALAAFSSVRVADAATRRYAVVVAHNQDLSGDAPPLEFADDDGARYYELLQQVADEVQLYAILDEDSQRLFRTAATAARSPRHADVVAGLDAMFERARRDRDRGDDVIFHFVLVGHGAIGAGGEGYVSLLDAPFTRSDLFQHVLAKSPATINHVIVDACNSYFLVHRRGEGDEGDDVGPSRRDAVQAFLSRERLESYPNTGFVLSTSSEKDSHEWSVYRGGVFSHQLRSALTGVADVNGDGAIAYSEVQAFVAAANAKITNPRARIELFARAPAIDQARPLMDLRDSRFDRWLRVPAGAPLRAYVEDARGVRYAEFNTSGARDLLIALVPSSHYYVRTHDNQREARVALRARGRIDVAPGSLRRSSIQTRGAVEASFRTDLYAEPFGRSFYQGYVASHGALSVEFDRARWLPAAVRDPHAVEVDGLLAALNARARHDRVLAGRLAKIRPSLLEALRAQHYQRAHELLTPLSGER